MPTRTEEKNIVFFDLEINSNMRYWILGQLNMVGLT